MQKTTVGILIYNNVEVLDFTGPYEVFSVTRLKNKPEFTDPSPFKILLISEYPPPGYRNGRNEDNPRSHF